MATTMRWEVWRCDVNVIIDGQPVRNCKHEGSCGAWERIKETDDPAEFYRYSIDFRGDRIPGVHPIENVNHPDFGKPLPPFRRWEIHGEGNPTAWWPEETHLGDTASFTSTIIPFKRKKKAQRVANMLNEAYRKGVKDGRNTANNNHN